MEVDKIDILETKVWITIISLIAIALVTVGIIINSLEILIWGGLITSLIIEYFTYFKLEMRRMEKEKKRNYEDIMKLEKLIEEKSKKGK